MTDFLPLALFGLGMGMLLIGAARYQQDLTGHTAELAKIREGQARMIEQEARSFALAKRNALALARIAAASDRDRA